MGTDRIDGKTLSSTLLLVRTRMYEIVLALSSLYSPRLMEYQTSGPVYIEHLLHTRKSMGGNMNHGLL